MNLIIDHEKLRVIANGTAIAHRTETLDYEYIMAAVLRSLIEAAKFGDKMGWESAEVTTHNVERRTAFDAMGGAVGPILSYYVYRRGEGPERSFKVTVNSDLTYNAKL